MYNTHTEMPTGARSRGYDRNTEAEAVTVFDQMVSQIKTWKNFVVDVVITDESNKEIKRERIENAQR